MILVFDIGNTNIVLGLFKGEDLEHSWRIISNRYQSVDEYAMIIKNLFDFYGVDFKEVEAVVISSVVPPLTPLLVKVSSHYFNQEPLVVGPGIKTGIAIRYENAREVGADRIVNAVAAYTLYGGPLIVVDFGTATTFCAVTAHGEYLGGAIAPGINISTEALYQKTSKLSKVEVIKPRFVIGKNTVASIQAGVYFGFVGQVEGIVTRMKQELKPESKVVATGGYADLIYSGCSCIDVVDSDLTLKGLNIIYHKNLLG